MELWGKDYLNMVGRACIEVGDDGRGRFRFGLVSAEFEGHVVSGPEERFEFTFEGYDENDPVHGFGWIRKINEDTIEGEIVFHDGDRSKFRAKRAKD